MKRRAVFLLVCGITVAGPACSAAGPQDGANRSIQPSFPVSPEHIAREIRRELVTLPSYSVFENWLLSNWLTTDVPVLYTRR